MIGFYIKRIKCSEGLHRTQNPSGTIKLPTILNTVMGLLDDQPDKGTISFCGTRIDGKDTEEIVRMGIGYVPEGRAVFEELTVRENLMMVPGGQSGEKLIDAWLRPSKVRAEEERVRVKADEVIDFLDPVLGVRRKEIVRLTTDELELRDVDLGGEPTVFRHVE